MKQREEAETINYPQWTIILLGLIKEKKTGIFELTENLTGYLFKDGFYILAKGIKDLILWKKFSNQETLHFPIAWEKSSTSDFLKEVAEI